MLGLLLVLAVGLWVLGGVLGASRRARWAMLGALYAGILAAQVLLPAGHAVPVAIGGTPQGWAALGLVGLLVLAYRAGLARLRARSKARQAEGQKAEQTGPFRPAELTRYARHLTLREIGGPGQVRLKRARVLVVGAGGIGAPVLLYLGAAGVGTIGVIDDDTVAASNLARQVIHRDGAIGVPKVISAAEAITAQNPFVTVRPYQRRITAENAAALLAEYDLVIDGSDNFETRALVNRAAVAAGKPLVSAAIGAWEGQLSLYDPASGGPCLACVFPTAPAPGSVPDCASAGVAGPLPGVLGTMAALEAVKEITGAGESLRGRMVLFDGLTCEARALRVARAPGCPVCGGGAGQAG